MCDAICGALAGGYSESKKRLRREKTSFTYEEQQYILKQRASAAKDDGKLSAFNNSVKAVVKAKMHEADIFSASTKITDASGGPKVLTRSVFKSSTAPMVSEHHSVSDQVHMALPAVSAIPAPMFYTFFEIIDVPADGNCCPHALVKSACTEFQNVNAIRQLAAKALSLCKDSYLPFVTQNALGEKTLDVYIRELTSSRRGPVWFNNLALDALARHSLPILVLSRMGVESDFAATLYPGDNWHSLGKAVDLAFARSFVGPILFHTSTSGLENDHFCAVRRLKAS